MLPRREVALHIKQAIGQCAVLHPIIVRRPRKHPLELQVIQWLVGQVEDGHHFLVLLALEATVVYRGNRIAGHRGPRGILAIGVLDMLEGRYTCRIGLPVGGAAIGFPDISFGILDICPGLEFFTKSNLDMGSYDSPMIIVKWQRSALLSFDPLYSVITGFRSEERWEGKRG